MPGRASTAGLADKPVSFDGPGPGLHAYIAEGDPGSGVVVGKDGVVVVKAQAAPAMAEDAMGRIAAVTGGKVTQIAPSHYHAMRVLGASGYNARAIMASDAGRASPAGRGPSGSAARTSGYAVVWLPKQRVPFEGDTVEFGATAWRGGACFADWPATLRAIRDLGPVRLVPDSVRAPLTRGDVEQGLADTEAFTGDLFARAREGVSRGWGLRGIHGYTADHIRAVRRLVLLNHCMPFDVSRGHDAA